MEWTIYLVLVIISGVRGEFISNFMFRNSSYDNKAFQASKLISTSQYRSVLDCAADCMKNQACKSAMFNTDTRFCQLLTAQMEAISDTTTKDTTGWVYFERMISTGRYISTQFFLKLHVELTSQYFFYNARVNSNSNKLTNTYHISGVLGVFFSRADCQKICENHQIIINFLYLHLLFFAIWQVSYSKQYRI